MVRLDAPYLSTTFLISGVVSLQVVVQAVRKLTAFFTSALLLVHTTIIAPMETAIIRTVLTV